MYTLGFAQTTISIQDFETPAASPEMTYTAAGGALYTGLSGGGDRPAISPLYSSFESAYGAQNTTATLTFMNNIGLDACSGKFFEFQLAAWSISSTGNGMEQADYVRVEISLDGGTTWSNELEVRGPNCGGCANARWDYTATGVASTAYDGDNTPSVFNASAGGTIADGHSTVRVSIPDASTQARIRITMLNNSTGERWTIDDVKLLATSCVCNPLSEPTVNASSISATATCTSVTIDFTRGNGNSVIVVMSDNCPIGNDPIDQTNYTASSFYGSGSTIGAGNYVVYNGAGNSVSVSGLTQGTSYCFKIYEYNGGVVNCEENYLITSVTETSFTTESTNCLGSQTCIKINEFVYRPVEQDGRQSDTGEWIELRNTCDCEVDISCMVVCMTDISSGNRRGDCVTIPSSTMLAAGGVFVMGGYGTNCTGSAGACDWPGLALDLNWHASASNVWDVVGNAFYTTNVNSYIGVLTNSGEDVSLFSNTATFLDGVTYNGGTGASSNNIESIGAVSGCSAKSITIPTSATHTSLGNEPNTSVKGYSKNCDGSWTQQSIISNHTPKTTPENCALIACIVQLSSDDIHLTGKANHKVNDLYWNTDEHLLAQSFIIEKSSDNTTFTPLQEVANRGVSRYSMSDFTPYATTYYRVAVVQKNGDVSYSNTIVLTNKTKAGGFSVNDIHPNPANTAFSFQFELAERGASVAFKMYNILGELVEYKELSSSQIITLQTDNLESGIYYLVFSSETEQQSHKLLIQH
jgi:hypothetical protein